MESIKMARTKKTTKNAGVKVDYKLQYAEDLINCGEPNRLFNVGDRIQISSGNLGETTVKEVLEDGKIYLIHCPESTNGRGEPIPATDKYFMWYEVRKVAPVTTESFITADPDLHLSYSQREIDGLLTIIYHFGCDFSPEYQREFVWTLEDKQALIVSIFKGIDIGKFVFVHLGYTGRYGYEILDGKQRLKTIQEFFEDRFPYKGKYYSDLSTRDRRYLSMYNVSYAELRDATREQKLRTFIALNTRGRVLNNDQIEYAKQLYKEETGCNFEKKRGG